MLLKLAKLLIGIGLVSITWNSALFEVAAGATVSDIFIASGAALAAYVLRLNARKDTTGLDALSIVVVLVVVGGTIGAIYTGRSFAGLDVLAFTAASGSAMLLFRTVPPSDETLGFMMLPLFAGLLINAGYGLLVVPEFSNRSEGLSVHPNTFGLAGLMLVGLGFATVLGQTRRRLVLAVLAVPVGVACALQSGSRAAIVGIVLSSLIAASIVLTRRSIRTIAISAVSGAVVLMLSYGRLSSTIGYQRLLGDGSSEASDIGRLELRLKSQELIDSSPFFGSGFDDGLAAHSVPLQLWQIAGILGLCGLVGLGYVLVVRPLRMDFGRRRSAAAPSLAISTLGLPLALWLLFSNALWEGEFWIAVALVAATSGNSIRNRPRTAPDPANPVGVDNRRPRTIARSVH